MSRIGKQPITIPSGVEVTITKENVTVKGPKGELVIVTPRYVKFEQKDGQLDVTIPESKKDTPLYKARHGLARTLINNMVVGVSDGFKKELEMKGIGYRAQTQGNDLVLNVGYSHPVTIKQIPGISFKVVENVNIIVEGTSKEVVGQVAANIRKVRLPEPYKGKGIKYKDEVIRRKSGKSGKGAGKGAK